jgi:hypothetical protein
MTDSLSAVGSVLASSKGITLFWSEEFSSSGILFYRIAGASGISIAETLYRRNSAFGMYRVTEQRMRLPGKITGNVHITI